MTDRGERIQAGDFTGIDAPVIEINVSAGRKNFVGLRLIGYEPRQSVGRAGQIPVGVHEIRVHVIQRSIRADRWCVIKAALCFPICGVIPEFQHACQAGPLFVQAGRGEVGLSAISKRCDIGHPVGAE